MSQGRAFYSLYKTPFRRAQFVSRYKIGGRQTYIVGRFDLCDIVNFLSTVNLARLAILWLSDV